MPRKRAKKQPQLREKLPEETGALPSLPHLDVAQKDVLIRGLMNSLNEKDQRHLVLADEAPNTYTLRRPTGLINLDITIGGGFPAGGLSFIAGPENSGKTWLLLKMMAMQQRLYGDACRMAFAVSERQFPYDVALAVGLRIPIPDVMIEQWNEVRRLRGMPPFTPEELLYLKQKVGDIYIIRGATGEQILQTILECVKTNAFSLIGCDSEQGLLPEVDSDKTLDEREMRAAHANMMGRFYKLYIPHTTGFGRVVPNQTTLIFTKQFRSNPDKSPATPYAPSAIPAGSWTGKHYGLINLVLHDAKVLKRGEGESKEAYGKMIHWKTDKGSAGTFDNRVGEAAYYYALGGTDDMGDLITAAIRYGVLRIDKKVTMVQHGTGTVLSTTNTQKAMRELLSTDVEHELAMRREVLAAAGYQCLYR
jgi:RecA/RadA recombinase